MKSYNKANKVKNLNFCKIEFNRNSYCNFRIHLLFHYYYDFPVEPNPPNPRCESGNLSTSVTSYSCIFPKII